MNQYFRTTMFAFLMSFGVMAYAGGVGSGGGGTTIPDPSSAEQIAQALQEESSFVIHTWLYRQEKNFFEQSPAVRAKNPLRKIFETKPGIFNLITTIPVEIRMSQACFDDQGRSVDGSIHGAQTGSLCMSAFSMAPKLSGYNYKAEAFALLVHEYSHLLGADEEEAIAIQKIALKDFLAKTPEDLKLEMKNLSLEIVSMVQGELEFWVRNPETLKGRSDRFVSLFRSYQDIQSKYDSGQGRYLLVPAMDDAFVAAEYVRFGVLDAFVCSQDAALGSLRQNKCQETLDGAFKGAASATVETISVNLGLQVDGMDPHVAKKVVMMKPTSWEILGQELDAVRNTFLVLNSNLETLIHSRILTYLTR